MSVLKKLKRDEGFSHTVYKDINGHDTIGYGFCIAYLHLSRSMCNDILKNKILLLRDRLVNRLVNYRQYTTVIQDILIQIAYQIGVSGLCEFENMLKYIDRNDFINAAYELEDSLLYRKHPKRISRLIKILQKIKT